MEVIRESTVSTVVKKKLKRIAVQVIPILVLNALFISSSLFIKIIDYHRSFVPCSLDYLRTFILSTLSSVLINYGTKRLSHFYNLKIPIEFMALLLLAYPQKTEIDQTFSSWNLVKRESYLFGAIYNSINQLIYLVSEVLHIWFEEIDEIELRRQESNDNINELVRKKSTLSNCIQVRRNSYSIKKNIYHDSGAYQGSNYADESDSLLPNKNNDANNTLVLGYNSDSIEFLNPSTSQMDNSVIKTPNLTPILSNYGSVASITSLNINQTAESPFLLSSKSQFISLLEIISWSIISSIYEIGISLILSITFIYVPELDDSYFSWLEIFYYNNILNFLIEIVIPLAVITSSVHYYLLPRYNFSAQWTLLAFSSVSFVLFTFGLVST